MSPHISSYRRRRRGEWRLEKVKPAVATVRVCYRDEMWWSRHGLLDAEPRSRDVAATTATTAATAGGSVRVKAEGEGGAAAAAVAAPIVKTERRPGEAPRAPGKPWS